MELGGRGGRLPALTSLRFVAAMVVVVYHTVFLVAPVWARESRVLALGLGSVSFFFLLSGYILATVYLGDGRRVNAREFYWARVARVYPLVVVTLLMDVPFLLATRVARDGLGAGMGKTGASLVGSALLVQGWVPALGGINFPSWSLSVEALFYALFPVLGVALWRLRGVRIWVLAAAVYLGGQALVAAAGMRFSDEVVSREPLLHLPVFVLGILLARWQSGREFGSGTRWAVLAGAVAMVTATVWIPRGWLTLVNDGLLAPAFAGVVLVFSRPFGWLGRVLSMRWMEVLGEASFGLYLLHIPLLHAMMALGWQGGWGRYGAYLAVCLGLSVASFYGFETPARRWILGWSGMGRRAERREEQPQLVSWG
jgi:peptidoglycan/LPS O-acetylase OafA/YrhL